MLVIREQSVEGSGSLQDWSFNSFILSKLFPPGQSEHRKRANKNSLFTANSFSHAMFMRKGHEKQNRGKQTQSTFLFSPETSKNLIRKKNSFCLIGASKEHMAWHRLYTLRHQSTWQEAEATSTNYNLNC